MAEITSADVTVTVNASDRDIAGPGAFKNLTVAQLVFGDGALTYPTGGIPLPAIGAFGLNKGIDMALVAPAINGFVYKYDKTNHKMLIYTQGVVTGATAAGATENGALATNSAGTEATAPRLSKTAPSTTYDLGPLIQLPATIAPAATTLQMLIIGQ
jgi:hypothetical protein